MRSRPSGAVRMTSTVVVLVHFSCFCRVLERVMYFPFPLRLFSLLLFCFVLFSLTCFSLSLLSLFLILFFVSLVGWCQFCVCVYFCAV